MTAFTDKLGAAANTAGCGLLKAGGEGLISAGFYTVGRAGGGGLAAIGLGAASLMAYQFAGCADPWDPNKPSEVPSGPPIPLCYEGASEFRIQQLDNGQPVPPVTPWVKKITGFTTVPAGGQPGQQENLDIVTIGWEKEGGGQGEDSFFVGVSDDGTSYGYRQEWKGDPTCSVPSPPPGPEFPPHEHTAADGCKLTVNFKGFAGTPNGVNPVWKIEPSAELLRADGPIGGCNFAPTLYYEDPAGGPPVVAPYKPEWDEDTDNPFPWGPVLDEILEGVGAAATQDQIDEKFDTPLAATVYRLRSVCEVDSNGNPVQEEITVPVEAQDPFSAITARLDALIPLLQGQKDFKQPVCPPAKAEGDIRTISFRSEEVSPNGKSRLRKRLRYRSISGIGLDGLIDHWKDFSFNAGPVVVKHRGSNWGTIAVWASDAAEGKRVILHAAAEAGIDANQTGRWEIGGSVSSRLGMPGTMNIDTTGGYYWITCRDGSDNRPLVGRT